MFNDERERVLFEEHEGSIQAWGKRLEAGAQHDPRPLRGRLLLPMGKALIRFGTTLTKRYGSTPRDHAFS